MLYFLTACTDRDDVEHNTLSDYKPMLFVQGQLYADTGNVIQSLPSEIVEIGEVKKLVSQNEPMLEDEFTSNTLPIGSLIFSNESNFNIVYIQLEGKDDYLVYELLN